MKKTKNNIMKKYLKITLAVAAIGTASYAAYNSNSMSIVDNTFVSENVLAISECSATYNGKVVLECVGEIGTCHESVKKFGQTFTLDCSGTKKTE